MSLWKKLSGEELRPEKKSRIWQIRLTPSLSAWLEETAKNKEMSVSQIVRIAIKQYKESESKPL